MEKNKISIIIPVYNIKQYLRQSIESIMQQTYSNLEIILVDDGSTDSSEIICDEYAKLDNRIKVIHKKNGGLSDARNAGIEKSTGEFLLFIDGDDYVDRYMVEVLLKRIRSDNTDMAICSLEKVDEAGHALDEAKWILQDKILSVKEYWLEMYSDSSVPYVIACSKLYKRFLFEKVRYPKGKIHEDEFVIHKIVSGCTRISLISQKLYYYVQHEGSIMHKPYEKRRLQVLEAFSDRIDYFLEGNEVTLAWQTLQRMRGILLTAYKGMDMRCDENRNAFNQGKKLHWMCLKRCCQKKVLLKQILKAMAFTVSPELYFKLSANKTSD